MIRLSDSVVEQLKRVWCSECGKPSIYPDDEFFAHYETHLGERDWHDSSHWWAEQRRVWMKRFQTFRYYTEYAYREEGWK